MSGVITATWTKTDEYHREGGRLLANTSPGDEIVISGEKTVSIRIYCFYTGRS